MPLEERLLRILDTRRIPYSLTKHRAVVRAKEMATVERLPAREVAKTIVVCGDHKFHLIVVPADRHVDLHEVQSILNLNHVRLATEAELATLFPDCELGAMPPVGILYDLPVYLDADLAAENLIAFNAGTHHDAIHMRIEDFLALTQPKVVSLAQLEGAGLAR